MLQIRTTSWHYRKGYRPRQGNPATDDGVLVLPHKEYKDQENGLKQRLVMIRRQWPGLSLTNVIWVTVAAATVNGTDTETACSNNSQQRSSQLWRWPFSALELWQWRSAHLLVTRYHGRTHQANGFVRALTSMLTPAPGCRDGSRQCGVGSQKTGRKTQMQLSLVLMDGSLTRCGCSRKSRAFSR